jgi:predicted GNAT family acetyltransferase
MQKQKDENKRVVFRRIGGRIVPITIAAVGAGVAADAARSDVVRTAKDGSYSIRRKGSVMPMALTKGEIKFGTSVTNYTKYGQRRGHINFFKNVAGEGEVDWLGVGKKFRGKGISKNLTSDAAAEMRSQGIKKISSHVVHERSAKLFGDKVRSRFYKSYYTGKDGSSFVRGIGKKAALAYVNGTKWKGKQPAAAIFRDVVIPKMRRNRVPFKSIGIKSKIGLGLGLFGYGLYKATER